MRKWQSVLFAAVTALTLTACQDQGPKQGEFTVESTRGLSFRRESGASLDEVFEGVLENAERPCTAADWACISLSITNAGSTWDFFGDSYLQAQPGTAQAIWTTGAAKVIRGYYSLIAEPIYLYCGQTNTRSCPDTRSLSNTCAQTLNQASLTTRHVIKLSGYYPSIGNLNKAAQCQGPTLDPCNDGGGDDDGDGDGDGDGDIGGDDDDDPPSTLSCGTGGGGGDDDDLVCETEWMSLEISFDNGFTWHTLWEGWVDICGYEEDMI